MSSVFGKVATLGQRAVTLSAFGVMCSGIYTISKQVSDIRKNGIRDPDDGTPVINTGTGTGTQTIQLGDNETFFQEKKEE